MPVTHRGAGIVPQVPVAKPDEFIPGSPNALKSSRLGSDFEKLEILGKGAFGTVMKVGYVNLQMDTCILTP